MNDQHEADSAPNAGPNAAMKNKASRDLYTYWNRIRRSRFAPWRSEVEPSDIHLLLPDVFILEFKQPRSYRFRLAGTRICATHRRELKGQDFLKMWNDPDRDGFETLLHNVSNDGAVGIVTMTGTSDRGQHVRMEMIILPLRHHDGTISRFIGSLSTKDAPFWLGTNPVIKQTADSVRLLWPDDQPKFLDRAVNDAMEEESPQQMTAIGRPVRRVRHLAVYDGGLGE